MVVPGQGKVQAARALVLDKSVPSAFSVVYGALNEGSKVDGAVQDLLLFWMGKGTPKLHHAPNRTEWRGWKGRVWLAYNNWNGAEFWFMAVLCNQRKDIAFEWQGLAFPRRRFIRISKYQFYIFEKKSRKLFVLMTDFFVTGPRLYAYVFSFFAYNFKICGKRY